MAMATTRCSMFEIRSRIEALAFFTEAIMLPIGEHEISNYRWRACYIIPPDMMMRQ